MGCTVLLSLAMLNACTPPPPPVVSNTRLYAIDQQGAAKICTAPPVKLTAGQEAASTLSVENDGGWCAITVAAPGDKPYAAGLLTGTPAHGIVYVHTVGDTTRVDYTPDRGFTGADTYVVKFLPGTPTLRVAVTVTPGSASVVTPPPAPAPTPAPVPTKKPRARS
jgi:hypothetical protein